MFWNCYSPGVSSRWLFRRHKYMGVRVGVFMCRWVFERVGVWLCGCVGVWVCGWVDVWVCGRFDGILPSPLFSIRLPALSYLNHAWTWRKWRSKRVKWHKKQQQGCEEGGRNMKKSEDRRLMRIRWRTLGRGQGRKRKRMRPKGQEWRARNRCRWSLLDSGINQRSRSFHHHNHHFPLLVAVI